MLNIISSLYQNAMAFVNLADYHARFAIIRAHNEGVPISFPLGSDRVAVITTIFLGLWFQLDIAFLHIDEEVFDSATRNFFHTIG
jgi:hypothetical protein